MYFIRLYIGIIRWEYLFGSGYTVVKFREDVRIRNANLEVYFIGESEVLGVD